MARLPVTVNLDFLPQRLSKATETYVIRRAIDRVAQASGPPFYYAGTTRFIPQNNSRHNPNGTFTIAWMSPFRGPGYSSFIGKDRAYAAAGVDSSGRFLYTSNSIAVDRYNTGPRPMWHREQIYMHEMGHWVGLGHTDWNNRQIMGGAYAFFTPRFGAGDITGMKILGRSACGSRATSAGPNDIFTPHLYNNPTVTRTLP